MFLSNSNSKVYRKLFTLKLQLFTPKSTVEMKIHTIHTNEGLHVKTVFIFGIIFHSKTFNCFFSGLQKYKRYLPKQRYVQAKQRPPPVIQ